MKILIIVVYFAGIVKCKYFIIKDIGIIMNCSDSVNFEMYDHKFFDLSSNKVNYYLNGKIDKIEEFNTSIVDLLFLRQCII